MFFVQNYGFPMWGHTWSLAVEEHFYLMLPILLAISSRDNFRGLVPLVAVSAVCLLALRCLNGPFDTQGSVFPTHLRMDSLLFGIVLSYLHHFHREAFLRVSRIPWLVPLGVLMLAPAFIWPLESTRAIYTVGFTGFYLGSGAILVGMMGIHLDCAAIRYIAAVGGYSYSIYLWHAAVVSWMFPAPTWSATIAYMLASVLIGIGLSKLIEMPVLRLREDLVPA